MLCESYVVSYLLNLNKYVSRLGKKEEKKCEWAAKAFPSSWDPFLVDSLIHLSLPLITGNVSSKSEKTYKFTP